MCINDESTKHSIGNVNEQTIDQIWNGQALHAVREIHRRSAGHRELEPCKTCIYPQKTKKATARVDGRQLGNYEYAAKSEEVAQIS